MTELATTRCQVCGTAILYDEDGRGPAPLYCGRAHRQKAYRDRQAEDRAQLRAEVVRLSRENRALREELGRG